MNSYRRTLKAAAQYLKHLTELDADGSNWREFEDRDVEVWKELRLARTAFLEAAADDRAQLRGTGQ